MSFFEADRHHGVEGVDTINACYGGTNALFSTINWIHSQRWKGAYGVVTCSDPAVHPDPRYVSNIGASSISLLVGPLSSYVLAGSVTFMKHSWDFY